MGETFFTKVAEPIDPSPLRGHQELLEALVNQRSWAVDRREAPGRTPG